MVTTTLTIVEFLTVRLDEEAADIDGNPYDARYRDLEFGYADITAKRAIVEFMRSEDAVGSGLTDAEGIARSLRAIAVLRWLASVYADHPDYRQEWKP